MISARRTADWRTRVLRPGWGLGRHVMGSNYCHYVRDPWGSYANTIDHRIHSGDPRVEGADHPGEDFLYGWGSDTAAGIRVKTTELA